MNIGTQVSVGVPAFSSSGCVPKSMPSILCCIYLTALKKLKRKRKAGMCEGTGGKTGWEGSWMMKGLACLAEELEFYSESRNHRAAVVGCGLQKGVT